MPNITFTKVKLGTLVGGTLAALITAGYIWQGSTEPKVSPTDYYELFQGVQERVLATVYDDHSAAQVEPSPAYIK